MGLRLLNSRQQRISSTFERMPKLLKVHGALFLVNLIYGGNYTIAKEVMPKFIEPFGFILLRVIGALLLYFIAHSLFVKEKVVRTDLPKLALCGLFGVATNQLFFFKGLSLTTPINASLLMITTPILVMTISAFSKTEKISLIKIAGLLFGATGAYLVISDRDFSFGSSTLSGDIMIMLNAMSYGIYLVLVKPLMKKYHPLTVIKWVFTFGFFPVLIFGFNELSSVNWSTFSMPIWWAVIYVVIGVTFVAYLLNLFALKEVNPSVVGIYVYLQPILASLIALSVGKDELSLIKLVAAAFIFAGVYLVSVKKGSALKA